MTRLRFRDGGKHPAPFSPILLPLLADLVKKYECRRILDPFAGTGRIFRLWEHGVQAEIEAIEIEPDWAGMHPNVRIGNALDLPFPAEHFDCICTSPVYGNRMSDCFRDGQPHKNYRRNTYTHRLGRELHPDNAGRLQWGDAYRRFHVAAWREATRVLQPGGIFILNIKDHVRNRIVQPVSAWHERTIARLGYTLVEHVPVRCPGLRHGANHAARVDHENVLVFQRQR